MSQWVGTIEALLEARQAMERGRLFLYFGDALIERLAGYVDGYRACMRENGLPDDRYDRFRDWLRDVKRKQPVEENPGLYLHACHGDHEQAIRQYFELVAEFASLHTAASTSRSRTGATGVLPYLLRLRQALHQGQLLSHVREVDVERFDTLVDGYIACLEGNGLSDGQYGRFRDWLRDVKKAFPGEGWHVAYLRDCHGDHTQAISKYLDFVAEFSALNSG